MPSVEELSAQLAEANAEIQKLTVSAGEWRAKAADGENKLTTIREGLRPILEALE